MMGEYDAGYENCIDAMVRQMEDMQYRIDCLHAENAGLHAELTDLRLMSCPSCGIKVENEQLRELCATVIDDWMSKVCPSFPFCECGGEYQDCTDETCGNQIYKQMARELAGWAHEHD